MSPIDDRRVEDRGPPPGIPDRRRLAPTFENTLTAGNIMQTGAIILSALGAACTAIFTAGAYVQTLRDDLRTAEIKTAETKSESDQRIVEILKQIAESRQR